MIRQVIISQGIMNGAHFLALPLLVIHFAAVPGIGLDVGAFALALFLGVARIGPLLAGPLADRLGLWTAFRLGLTLRGVGLALVVVAQTPVEACAAVCLLGLGVALQEPATYALLARSANPQRALLRHIQALNAGCLIGPGLAMLASIESRTAFSLAALATAALTTWAVLIPVTFAGATTDAIADKHRSRVRVDLRFAAFAALLVPFWAIVAQLFGALPIMLNNAGGSLGWAQSVIFINGLIGITLVPVLQIALRGLAPEQLLPGGCLLASIACLGLAVEPGLTGLLLIVVAVSIAETVVAVASEIMTARTSERHNAASCFGLLSAGAGIGMAAGAALGVAGISGQPMLLIGLAIMGLIACAAPLSAVARRKEAK